MGKVEEQERRIFEVLKTRGQMTLQEAKDLLGISESTVRRLFIGLEKSGRAVRNYGGIQYFPESRLDYSYEALEGQNVREKKLIAAHAVSLVQSGETIYMDSGTTLSQFSAALHQRLAGGALKDITIFTNSLINLNLLQNAARLLLIGGEYRENRKDFCGYIAEETLKSLHFTKCFLGSDGFNPNLGFTTTDFYTARLNEIVLQNSIHSYVLMDSSKFNTSAVVSYSRNCPPSALITDEAPPDHAADVLSGQKTQVEICPSGHPLSGQ